jgi:putative membrane protein
MAGLLLMWLGNSFAIWLVAYLFSSVNVASWTDAFIAGFVLTLINAIVRPILLVLTLPITVVTLGLFYFVITAICLGLTAKLIDGFSVSGWFMTIIASIFISILSAVIQSVLKPKSR